VTVIDRPYLLRHWSEDDARDWLAHHDLALEDVQSLEVQDDGAVLARVYLLDENGKHYTEDGRTVATDDRLLAAHRPLPVPEHGLMNSGATYRVGERGPELRA